MSDFDLRLGNSDAIARELVRDAYSATGEINYPLKRLLIGAGRYRLNEKSKADLIKMQAFLAEAQRDVGMILNAQRAPVQLLEAAE